MQVIVITGGIASGKTEAAQWLRKALSRFGVVSFSADASVHRHYEMQNVRRELALRLGLSAAWAESESPANFRSKIRSMTVCNPGIVEIIEDVLHPLVWADYWEAVCLASSEATRFLIAEIPLYYETGNLVSAHLVVAVAASEPVQLKRLQLMRSTTLSEAERLIGLQLPVSKKITAADIVVWNDGALDAMLAQLRLLVEMIGKLNK